MIRLKRFILILWGAGLMACSSHVHIIAKNEVINVAGTDENKEIESFIEPYRDSLKEQMNEIVAFTREDLTVNRKPSGTLSNWAADALLSEETKNVRLLAPVIAILNTGGLRASLNKGNLTLGDFYRLMPFDNEVVWVKLPVSSLEEIHKYFLIKGGDPIANAFIDEVGIHFNSTPESYDSFWVISSDYLVNGGDNMVFFQKAIEKNQTGRMLRDVFVNAARNQDTLIVDSGNRMKF